jgi:hypothetical protein
MYISRWFYSLICVLILVSIPRTDLRSQASDVPVGGFLTLEAVEELAYALHEGFNSGNGSVLEDAVDRQAMVRRMLEMRPAMMLQVQNMESGLNQGLVQLAKNIVSTVNQGAAYDLYAVRKEGSNIELVFRLITTDGRLNYHAYRLTGDHNEARIADIYVYMTASWLSEMLAEMVAMSESNEPVAGITVVNHHMQAGEIEAARAAFDRLSSSLKTSKFGSYLAVELASMEGEDEHRRAIEEMEGRYPSDPALSLLMSDHYASVGEFTRAHLALNRVDAHIGGDPYLDVLRSDLAILEGKTEEARTYAYRALESDPTLLLPYWTLISIALDGQKHDEVAKLLGFMRDELGLRIDLGVLSQEAAFASFVKSEAFQHLVGERH